MNFELLEIEILKRSKAQSMISDGKVMLGRAEDAIISMIIDSKEFGYLTVNWRKLDGITRHSIKR